MVSLSEYHHTKVGFSLSVQDYQKSLCLLFIGVLVGFIPFAIVSKCIAWLFMEFIEIDM